MKSIIRKNASFLTCVGLLLLVRGAFADQNLVPSGSMEPTIQVGDHIFVNRVAYDLKVPFSEITLVSLDQPKRGDIIVFHNPRTDMRMVKRLIGLPGDKLRIHDGFVSINGRQVLDSHAVEEAFMNSRQNEFTYREQIGPHVATIKRTKSLYRPEDLEITIPPDRYFAMGDNRDNSYDSRGWGLIPRSKIVGRAEGVLFNVTWSPLPEIRFERMAKRFI